MFYNLVIKIPVVGGVMDPTAEGTTDVSPNQCNFQLNPKYHHLSKRLILQQMESVAEIHNIKM